MKYALAVAAICCALMSLVSAMSEPCTDFGCTEPPASPDCKNVREYRPNGDYCPGLCRVCMDEVTPPPTPPPVLCTEIGCAGPQAGPNCRNVSEFRPNGPGCEPVCRICLDEPSRENLACPVTPFYFDTQRTEPICDNDADCAANEKCCFWGENKHCLAGIFTLPKPGSCPRSPPVSGFPNCIADYAGCQFDSECSEGMKCCVNDVCRYGECKPAVNIPNEPENITIACTEIGCGPAPGPDCKNIRLYRPNGPECEPVCRVCADPPTTTTQKPRRCTKKGCPRTQAGPDCVNVQIVHPNGPECGPACLICLDEPTRENLACPISHFWFPTERTEPRCERDSDCAADEICCSWHSSKHCLKGLKVTPKAGTCPASRLTFGAPINCRADYGGCRFDSECPRDEKCCSSNGCGYKECKRPQAISHPVPCLQNTCGPAPGPDCQTVRYVRPNGPRCEPVCRVCAGPPVIPTTTERPLCEMRWIWNCPNRFGSRGHNPRGYNANRCRYMRRRYCR